MKKLNIIIFAIFLLCGESVFAQTIKIVGDPKQKSFVDNVLIDAVAQIDTNARAAKAKLQYLEKHCAPNDAVNYYLGLIEYAEGNTESAETHIKKAIQLDSTNLWYWDALAGLYNSQRRGAEAADIYLKLLDKAPKKYTNAYTLTLLGDDQLASMKDTLALENYEKALVLSPGYAPALLGKAEVYRLRNNVPAFFTTIDGFVRDEDILPAPKCDYINQLLQHIDGNFYRGWKVQLDSLVNACIETHPTDSSAMQLAGSWYYGTGRPDEGIALFDKIVAANPDNLQARYIRMQLRYSDKRDTKEIIKECEDIVAIGGEKNPEVLPALSSIGDCYYEMGDDAKAFKAYDRVLKIDPEYVPVLNNYAYYLSLQKKQLSKAARMSKITVEKEPDNPTYLDTYGWILHLQGKDQEAKPYFKHAMIYGGKESEVILDHYAEVLKALGEDELAQYYKSLAESKKQ